MSKDYKNDITKYLTEEKFNNWWKECDSGYKELLKTLNIHAHEKITEVFEGENHILKFFWYKLLTRENMPAHRFDCDKAFFGKLNLSSFSPSELVNDWQTNKTSWSPDTANSYAELFKRFLAYYLPTIFQIKGNFKDKIIFEPIWTSNILSKIKSTNDNDSYAKTNAAFKKLINCHYKIIKYDNGLRLFSYYILFQDELFRQINMNCDKNELQIMQDFARLTHTPGNFILVSSSMENKKKNNKYGDFIDLYIKDQNEDFIKGQHLSMYNEPLFIRRENQIFPDKNSFMTCIDTLNKKIIQREKELERYY
ncbi:hypothetical protein P6709_09895 [Jeotgalibacillus sp. ET6]|uniref:hypothetical protein n=1 Tax=Jeotgalibacillus sp. ET6 TaxID=3037260 RepID=UPI00241859AF|nr:hypothetical protein [Jeotgalibacillus sp. ET6]MDG5472063.1 hypothetical protein [Jeotgalibacillus sp. ET6]